MRSDASGRNNRSERVAVTGERTFVETHYRSRSKVSLTKTIEFDGKRDRRFHAQQPQLFVRKQPVCDSNEQ